jgi:hypothetical protein
MFRIVAEVIVAVMYFVSIYFETWSQTLKEEHALRVFQERVLSRIFGPKRGEVAGDWRKLRNGDLRNLYTSSSIIKMIKSWRMRSAVHVARVWNRDAYRLLMITPEGKRPPGRPRRRRMGSIRMDLREI